MTQGQENDHRTNQRCKDCHCIIHPEARHTGFEKWCEDCFEKGLRANMDDHFSNFIKQDLMNMTDAEKIEAAAADEAYVKRHHWGTNYPEAWRKGFIAGSKWRDANPSPKVLELLDVLNRIASCSSEDDGDCPSIANDAIDAFKGEQRSSSDN